MADYVLSAKGTYDGNGFNRGVSSNEKSIERFKSKCSAVSVAVGNVLANMAAKGFGAITSHMDAAISRVDKLNQFPKVMSNLGYSTDEASASMKKMSDGIEGLPTSLDEIVGNTQALALSLGDLGKATDVAVALNDGFLTFGASSSDVTNCITQLNQMITAGTYDMQSWNSINQSAPGFLDSVAKSMLGEGKKASDLRDALNDGKVSSEDFLNAIVDLDRNGTDGITAFSKSAQDAVGGIGTSMKNVGTAITKNLANIIDAVNGSGAISSFFDSIKVAINDIGKAVVPAAKAVGDMFAAIQNGTSVADALNDAVGGTKIGDFLVSSVQSIQDTIVPVVQGIVGDFQGIADGAMDAAGDIAQAFGPSVQPVLELAAGLVQTVWGAVKNLADQAGEYLLPAIENVAPKFGELASALEPLLPCLQDFASVAGNALVGVASIIITALGGVVDFVTGTIVPAVTGVVDFLAGVPAAIEGFFSGAQGVFDGFGDLVNEILGSISGVFTDTANAVNGAWLGVCDFFVNLPATISAALSSAAQAVAGFVASVAAFFMELPSNILYALGFAIGFVGAFVVGLGQKAIEAGTQFVGNLVAFFTQLPGNVQAWLTSTLANVAAWAANMASQAAQAASTFISNVASFLSELPGNVSSFLQSALSSAISWAASMAAQAMQAGSDFLNGVASFLSELPGRVADFLASVISSVASWVGEMASGAQQAASDFGNSLISGLSSIPGQVVEIGSQIISGLVNGITGAAGQVVSAISGAVGDGIAAAKSLLGIHSPSRVFKGIGEYTVEGLAIGIEKTNDAVGAMKSLADGLMSAGDNISLVDLGKRMAMDVASGIESKASVVSKAVHGVTSGASPARIDSLERSRPFATVPPYRRDAAINGSSGDVHNHYSIGSVELREGSKEADALKVLVDYANRAGMAYEN